MAPWVAPIVRTLYTCVRLITLSVSVPNLPLLGQSIRLSYTIWIPLHQPALLGMRPAERTNKLPALMFIIIIMAQPDLSNLSVGSYSCRSVFKNCLAGK